MSILEVILNPAANPIAFAICLPLTVILLVHLVPYLVDQHGLRRYPGPFLAKFTDGWLFWVSTKAMRTMTVDQLHQKYGPFVRIAPNHISVLSPAAVSAIYGHSTGMTKSAFYDTFVPFRGTSGIFSARSRPEHSRKRRIMSHMFAPQTVLAFEPSVCGHLSTLLNQWDYICTQVGKDGENEGRKGTVGSSSWEVSDGFVWFDARFWFNLFTFDVIGELAFGSQFGMLIRGQDTARIAKSPKEGMDSYALSGSAEKGPAQYEVEEISAINVVSTRTQMDGTVAVLPVYMRTLAQQLPQFRRGDSSLRLLVGMAADVVSRRLAAARQAGSDEKTSGDMFGKLLGGRDENGNPMSPEELTTESVTLLVAGSDTTSNSLSALIYYIARDQEVQRKLQAELDAVANTESSILPSDDIKSLPYLEAVINEGLRLLATIGIGLPRVVPAGGITVLGHTFPEGTELSIPMYSLHQFEEVWGPDVKQFRPERWLDTERKAEMMKAFNPFSFGPRACIGRNVAMLEMTLVIAAIFRRYHIIVRPGQPLKVDDGFIRKPHQSVVGIKRRVL